jgi:hypothetical protein
MSGASSIPLCYILFPATLLHQLIFHPPSLHFAIYFLVYLLFMLKERCGLQPQTNLFFLLRNRQN